jgi:hypothetical protein
VEKSNRYRYKTASIRQICYFLQEAMIR